MIKKGLAIALTTVMAIGLVGCGASSSKDSSLKLAEYKGLTVYADDIDVSDDDYKAMVDNLLSQAATTEQVKEGKVKKDSVVNVDYKGTVKVDGKDFAFDGGTATGTSINIANDAGQYIEGFVKSLIGKKVGEKVKANLKFPEDYANTTKDAAGKELKLAGKDVTFTFTINYLEKTVTPELTDEFAKEKYGMYGVTDIPSFEKYAREQMRVSNIMSSVWSKYLDECEVKTYNDKEVESMQTYYNDYYESYYQYYYGADIATYLEATSMSQSDWDDQMEDTAKKALKEKMVVNKIAEKEDLVPSGKEYESEAQPFVEQYTMENVSELESQYGADEVKYAIIYQKVQKFIAENVKIEEGSAPTTAAAEAATTAAE